MLKISFHLKPDQHLFVISGPSGVGKDTVIEGLKKVKLRFEWVITTTTRSMRKGEKDGKPYYFVNRKRFQKLIAEGKMIEFANVYGNYYGTTWEALESAFQKSKLVILKNDPQGARTIKAKLPQVVIIFIIPSNLETIEKRLRKRGTDSEVTIQKRIAAVKRDLADLSFADYEVVNPEGKPELASQEVFEIIQNVL